METNICINITLNWEGDNDDPKPSTAEILTEIRDRLLFDDCMSGYGFPTEINDLPATFGWETKREDKE